jgi:isocitrate/isopropylmalate dehydrogenase
MRVRRVAAIPGEDAAPEAFHPTVELIQRLGLPIEWTYPPVGQLGLKLHGDVFPPEARAAIDATDATLFGATSGPSFPALFYLRWGKGTYANVRPARWFRGCRSPLARPEGVDFTIVRENLEDMYVQVEGDVKDLGPLQRVSPLSGRSLVDYAPGRYALKVISEAGSERIARFAFELARKRRAQNRPGKVTCGTKHNMLPQADGLFLEVAKRVAKSYPDMRFESFIVDDLAHRLIARPHELDVVLLPNLYGDVLSDAAGALIGGLGLAPSGCYGDSYAYFESTHGSAPDIAGKGIINPTATLLSAVMMLEHLGFADEAARVTRAVEQVYAEGRALTPDQGGASTTREFCAAVAALLDA